MSNLETMVVGAINNAHDNGYDFEGWFVQDIAIDMLVYDADIEAMVCPNGDLNVVLMVELFDLIARHRIVC